jgi:large repetitive protein
MIRYKSVRLCGALVSALFFLVSSAWLANGISAQTAESALAGSPQRSAGSTPFLVAPSIPLGYAPSSVATGDLRHSGMLDLVTTDFSSGKITVFLGAGQGKFAAGVEYAAGAEPGSVLVADVNGDGRPDILVANQSVGTVSVLLGKGDGTFEARQIYPVGFNPSFIATGDFGGNGGMDLAVAGSSRNLLAVLLNDGSGNFAKPIARSLIKAPTSLAVADFNGDGRADIALGNADGTVSILLGKGKGQFSALADVKVSTGSLSAIAAADLNRDGKIDLVATQQDQKQVAVLLGNGDGTFASPTPYAVGHAPLSAVVADVNADGIADLVVVNSESNTFSVLNGNGDGTFQASRDFVAGNAPLAAVAGDFYGSGHLDLAIINHSSQTVSVPSGKGDGTFKAARSYVSGQQPVSIASGNINGGIKPGLVVANYCGSDLTCSSAGNVAVFLPDASGEYHLSASYTVGAGPVSVSLADVNGDKKLDIVAANRLDRTVTVLLGAGDGTFHQPATFPLAAAPVSIAVGDFNKDGKPDLAVLEDCGSATCREPGSVEILQSAEGGTFKSLTTYSVGYAPSALAVGDINSDKNLDIVVANRCGGDASCQSTGTGTVLLGNGSGKFTEGKTLTLGRSPSSLALGSLTGAGLDLVVSRSTDNTVAVLKGNGDGTFKPAVAYAVGNKPGSVVLSDFNGDGKPDVAVTNFTDSTVSVLYGRGDGTLQTATSLPVGANPVAMTAVGGASGGRTTLATADGSTADDKPGTEFQMSPDDDPGSTPFATFTLTATPGSSSVNDLVQLVASITLPAGPPAPPAPTANVVFSVGGVDLTDCGGSTGVALTLNVTTYSATCNTQTLEASSTPVTVTAEYVGDPNYEEQSTTASQNVSQLVSALTISPTVNTPINTSITFTATLTVPIGSSISPIGPTGSVSFLVDGSAATCTNSTALNSTTGVATCTVAQLSLGSHSIGASYAGDQNYTGFTATNVTQTIIQATPSLTITPTTSASLNTPVTFTATLTVASPGAITPTGPTGTVTFSIGGTPISCSSPATVNPATGAASCQTTSNLLVVGTESITASYPGDTNYTAASASAANQVITKASPSLTITPTTSATLNTAITFTATLSVASPGAITPTGPTGTVTFTVGGTAVSCTSPATVNSTTGVATCQTTSSLLVVGSDSIGASYGGDGNYNTAIATAVTQTITKLTPTVTISPTTAVALNTAVTFTATLSNVTFTPIAPTGSVAFTVGGTPVTCSGGSTLNSTTFIATCLTTSNLLIAGNDQIGATYSGDANYSTANATAVGQTVTKLSPAVGLSVLPTGAITVGTSVTFTAQLTGATLTPVTPSGTVNFTTGGGTSITGCGAVTISAAGTAICPTSSLVAPADLISAIYSGDGNFNTNTSNTVAETVNKSNPVLTVSGAPTTAAVNQSVTYTATVKAAAGTVLPTGSVTFSLTTGGTVICNSVTIVTATGIATCNYAFTAPATPGTTVTAAYSGDSNFNTGSGVTAAAEVVTTASTTTAITNATPSPSSVNQQVNFTATVTPAFTGSTLPTGTVTFTDTTTATAMCTETISGGVVPVCSYAFPANGSQSVTATYSGDTNFVTSTSTSFSQSVGASTTSVVLTSGPNPAFINQSVTFTASISTNSGSTTPQGTVLYKDTTANATLCTVTLTSNGTVPACAAAFTSPGAHLVTAAFTSSNSNFGNATSTALSETVNATATTTALTSAPASSSVNQSVTFSAVVTPAFAGSVKPTGTVTFTDTTTAAALCTSQPLTSATGTATCTVSFPSAVAQSVVATYSGDTNFTTSASSADTQAVATDPTATTVSSSAASATVNQIVTFTATIAPTYTGTTHPTGTVAFSYTVGGGAPVTLCAAAAVTTSGTGGTATCAEPFSSDGNYTVTATYSGSTNFASSSGTVLQPVGLTPTTTTVIASPTTSSVNQSVLFTATVTPSTTGSTNPTGSVTFTYSLSGGPSVILCSGAALTSATGKATCTGALPSAGSYAITASYSGDTNFASSSNGSSLLALTVTQPTTTLSLASTPTSSVVNQAVAFNAVITPGFTGTTLPTGTVSFTDTSTNTTLCTITVSVTGTVPTCSYGFLTAATHTVTATYSGDSNFPKTTSPVVSEVVSQSTTTTAVAASPTSSSVNQSVTFTATVLPTVSGATIPTGTVAFTYVLNGGSSVTLCATSTLSNLGIATCVVPLPSQGAYTITATYSGDTNFKTSSGNTPQTVTGSPTTTTVVASPNPSSVNQQVLFTATVKTTVTGSTSPTGTVAFTYSLNGGASVNLCTAAPLTTSTGVATCLQPLPAEAPSTAPYVVTAKYSGDANFVTSSSTVNQTVDPANLTITVASSQASSLVNQLVTFTATLTVANAGVAQPAATVSFKDTSTIPVTTLCAGAALTSSTNGVYVASCSPPVSSSWIAGTHSITATYAGDPNFPATTSPVFAQTVTQNSTSASVVSSVPVIIATESVTFTATVTPTQAGPVVPSGYFTFTSSGAWSPAASCQAATVAPITSGTAAGSATASCTATFPGTASTQTITAVYSHDPNFTGSTSAVTETVANFSIANTVTSMLNATPSAGPVVLTQGYSTASKSAAGTDPFNPTTVKVVVTSSGGLTDTLNVDCVVTNSTHAVVTDPSCTMSTTTTPPTATTISGANGTSLIYTLSASASAAVGAYTVTLSAADGSTPALSTQAPPLTLNIIGVAGPLSLAQGASGQENVTFNTFSAPQSDTFTSVACGSVVPLVNGVAGAPMSNPAVSCTSTIPSGGIPIVSGGNTVVAVSISTSSKTAALAKPSNISMAAFLGVPLLALFGWVGTRKSPRRNFFRFLGLILLLVGVSYASGCGGSFSSSSTTTSTGIAAGSYIVQVVGTDQHGTSYYAAIPLDVSAN